MSEGDPAPGVPGAVFGTIAREFSSTALGQVAFAASLVGAGVTNETNTGVWVADASGAVTLLAREGDAVPGVPDAFFASFAPPRISHTGRVAFVAHLRGGGAPQGFNVALLAQDQAGRLREIARTGTMFDATGQGDRRPVYALAFDHRSSESGLGQFNARGTLLFDLEFRQGAWPPLYTSGVYAATVGCRADFDGAGGLDIFDFLSYQNAFEARDPRADFDADGAFTVFDDLAFLNGFEVGRP